LENAETNRFASAFVGKGMNRPKILFVIDNLSTGGAQRQMVNLATGLKGRKYQVAFFCYAPGDLLAQPLRQAGIPVHWKFKSRRYSPGVALALRRLIRRERFDLVVSFLSTPNFYALIAGQLITRQRVPVVVSERFCDLPQGVPLMERLVRQFYRFAAHVVVNSHHQRENFLGKYPYLHGRLSTIYNGYDLRLFSPGNSAQHNEEFRILTISSVSPYKNGLCMVEALRRLRDHHGNSIRVSWVGQRFRKGENGTYLNRMEEAIQRYNLKAQWHWLDQRIDIVDLLHNHGVLVHPSYGEGLPNVVCEAMACARPVIVSQTLDHARLVENGKNGFLFDWQDPSDLAAKIHKMAKLSSKERQEMGQWGRRFAEVNLSLDRYIDDYRRLFQSLWDE
jgi:glycosyltransferase involved in cell wall biosynthesis